MSSPLPDSVGSVLDDHEIESIEPVDEPGVDLFERLDVRPRATLEPGDEDLDSFDEDDFDDEFDDDFEEELDGEYEELDEPDLDESLVGEDDDEFEDEFDDEDAFADPDEAFGASDDADDEDEDVGEE